MDHHDLRNREIIKRDSLISLGDVAVDVGANVGSYVNIFLENLGMTGSIYAIELMPETMKTLQYRFGNFSNVNFICGAASDHNGHEKIFLGNSTEQHNILGYGCNGEESIELGEIESFTLDTILEHVEKISFIKIDVEGAELKVLKGMTETAKKTKTILLENHFNEDWPEIRKILLEDFGFGGYNIETGEEITSESPRPYQCLLHPVEPNK